MGMFLILMILFLLPFSKYLFSSTDFNSYNTLSYSKGSPQRKKGKFEASNNIGLGIEINSKKIKNPVFKI